MAGGGIGRRAWAVGAGAAVIALSAGAAAGRAPACPGEPDQVILENGPGVERTYLSRVRVIGGTAWAVGWENTTGGSFTLTLRLGQGGWERVASPSVPDVLGDFGNSLFDVGGSGPDDVWAVGRHTGATSASDTLALHWDGSGWTHVPTPGESMFGAQGFQFEGVYAPGGGTVWFVGSAASCVRGEGYVVRRNGDGSFDEFCVGIPINAAARYRDVDGIGADDIWAVGGRGGAASGVGRAIAAHWDGSSWTPNNPPQTNFGEVLEAVVVIASDDVWATGTYDRIVDNVATATPLFWHWDGAAWTRHESPGFARDLVAFASDDVYGVSGRRVVHWDGQSWSLLDFSFDAGGAFSASMRGVSAFGPCDLVFAGHTVSPWKATLARLDSSAGCTADFTGDGTLDFADVAAFLDAFNGGDASADLTGDGVLNFFDVSAFVGAFVAGCP